MSTVTRSPTLKLPFVGAVPVDDDLVGASRGGRPSTSRNWLSVGFGSHPRPKVGGPFPPIALPVLVDHLRVALEPSTLPSAASTLGTLLHDLRAATPERSAGCAGAEVALEHFVRAHDRVGAAGRCRRRGRRTSVRIVAVSTNVPDMNATPSITAIAVSTKRILFAQRPLRVTFHIGYSPPSFRILSRIASAVGFEELVDDRDRRRGTRHGRRSDAAPGSCVTITIV